MEQAARVKAQMKDYELIDVFLQTQEPDYFHYPRRNGQAFRRSD